MESYVVLARRYRPRTFSEVLGQDHIARTLRHAIEKGRVAHAYLFAGPRGVGKTSMARILAKALCCQRSDGPTAEPCDECEVCRAVTTGDDLDVIEIDGASNRGIDEIRTLRDNARYTPARARLKIYIIDEVHMLTEQAFNALLKTLEEPPPHVKFIFATTGPEKVPNTILSRCQRFDFRRIPARTIAAHLRRICEGEGVVADPVALLAVATASAGGMRDAQSLLDQLIILGGGEVREADLESLLGTVSVRRMENLFRSVGAGEAGQAIRLFESVYEDGVDAAEFLRQALAYARDLLLVVTCGEDTELLDLTPEAQMSLAEVAKLLGASRIMYALGLFAETLKTVKAVGEGRALAELAIAKLAQAGNLRSLDEIIGDISELEKRVKAGVVSRAPAPTIVTSEPAGSLPAPAAERPGSVGDDRGEALFVNSGLPDGALDGEETVRLTLERVRESWGKVLERVKDERSGLGTFLGSGRVLGLTDRALELGFTPANRFHKAQIEGDETSRVVEAAIESVLGVRLKLVTVVTEQADDAPPEEEADPAAPGSVSNEEMARIGKQPIVNTLKDLFTARLVHIERT